MRNKRIQNTNVQTNTKVQRKDDRQSDRQTDNSFKVEGEPMCEYPYVPAYSCNTSFQSGNPVLIRSELIRRYPDQSEVTLFAQTD